MKCPVCQNDMKVISQDTSNNSQTGQKYDRIIYNCNACDTWANTEIPQRNESI